MWLTEYAMDNKVHMNFISILVVAFKFIPKTESTVVTCDGVVFNDTYYEKEELVKDVEKAYNLVIHRSSNQLFFSHTIWDRTEVDFTIMTYDLKTKATRNLNGIPGGYAIAYDQAHDGMYLGGHDGIYKFNPDQNTITFFAENDVSIWALFVGKNFYYIRYPTQKLYVYKNGKFVKVSELNMAINTIFVSNKSDIYFSNDTTLFKVEDLSMYDPIILSHNVSIKQIVEDSHGNVFFCASDGIYTEEMKNKVKKIANIDNAFGLTFDENDQVIFSNVNTIYKLVPSSYGKICIKVLDNAEKEEEKKRRYLLHDIMALH